MRDDERGREKKDESAGFSQAKKKKKKKNVGEEQKKRIGWLSGGHCGGRLKIHPSNELHMKEDI